MHYDRWGYLRPKKAIYISALLLIWSTGSLSSDVKPKLDTDKTISFSQAYNEAVNSLNIRGLRRQKEKAASLNAQLSGRAYNPEVGAEFGQKTGTTDGLVYQLSFSQEFYAPGAQTATKKIALAKKKQQLIAAGKTELLQKAAVISILYRLHSARTYNGHMAERLSRWDKMLRHLRSRPRISVRDRATLLVVDSRIRLLNQQQSNQRNRSIVLEAQLQHLVPDIKQTKLKGIILQQPDIELAAYKELAVKGNRLLAQQTAELGVSEAMLEYAGTQKYPGYSLGAFYRQEPSGISRDHFFGVTASMRLPLFRGSSKASKSAQAKIKSLNTETKQIKLQIQNEAAALFYRLQNDYAIATGIDTSEQANIQKRLEYLDREFLLGRLDVAAYFEAESVTHEFIHNHIENQARYAETLLEFALLTGDISFLEEAFNVNTAN